MRLKALAFTFPAFPSLQRPQETPFYREMVDVERADERLTPAVLWTLALPDNRN